MWWCGDCGNVFCVNDSRCFPRHLVPKVFPRFLSAEFLSNLRLPHNYMDSLVCWKWDTPHLRFKFKFKCDPKPQSFAYSVMCFVILFIYLLRFCVEIIEINLISRIGIWSTIVYRRNYRARFDTQQKMRKKNQEPNWNVFQEVFCFFVFICIGCRLSLNQRAEKCASFEAVIIIGQLFLLHSCILADLDFASKPTYVYFYIFWLIYSEFVLILGNWQCSPYCDSCCDTQIAVVSIDLDFL